MKKSVRMARICDLRRISENRTAADLASARQELAGSRQLLSDLQQHRDDYKTRLLAVKDKRLPAMQWRGQREFISTLDQVISQQQEHIDQADQKLVSLYNRWRKRHAERRALDELVQHTRDRERRDDDRQEQRAQDDLSCSRRGDQGFGTS